MSHPLLEYIHARFREHFGDPNSTLARDSQWSLRGHTDPRAPSIFVLVNGSHEKPAAWIFDPYDGIDGVWKCSIGEEADVEKSIQEIRRRLKVAAGWQMDGTMARAQVVPGALPGPATRGAMEEHMDGGTADGR